MASASERAGDDDDDLMQLGDIADELEVTPSGARWLIDTGRIVAQRAHPPAESDDRCTDAPHTCFGCRDVSSVHRKGQP